MSSPASGIECSGLSRSYCSRQALADLDLMVPRGTLTVLLGSNGAGKTTLLKILATLVLPTRGQAAILGQNVVAHGLAARRLLGFVPAEERSFFGRLTVLQNLEFFAALHGLSRGQCWARSERSLADLGLGAQRSTPFAELSSGMKQSLALVRSLLHDPPVLLLDEPTRSLSPDLALRAQVLLRSLVREEGRTVLLATHNLGEAEALADQVAILHGGRIMGEGEPASLADSHGLPDSGRMAALFTHFTNQAPEMDL